MRTLHLGPTTIPSCHKRERTIKVLYERVYGNRVCSDGTDGAERSRGTLRIGIPRKVAASHKGYRMDNTGQSQPLHHSHMRTLPSVTQMADGASDTSAYRIPAASHKGRDTPV